MRFAPGLDQHSRGVEEPIDMEPDALSAQEEPANPPEQAFEPPEEPDGELPPPYELLLRRKDWSAAAAAWDELGCPYEAALALTKGTPCCLASTAWV